MATSVRGFNYFRVARRADTAMVICVVVFFVAFFARLILQHRFILTGDAFYYTYPMRTIAWEMIRDGTLPLWTPLILSGYPLLAVGQLAIGYPFTWTYLFLPGHWAEQICVLTPFLLSPLTTYAYCREIGRSPLASLLAGLSFGYGGMMSGILANSGMLTNGFAWAPLALIFVERARTRPFANCLVGAGLTYGLSVLSGHSQSYVYVGTLIVAYGLFTSLSLSLAHKRPWRAWATWRPLFVALGALILAAGLAAFQLLEIWRAARRSIRSALTYEIFSEGSFRLREALLSLGAPIYHYVDSGTYLTPLAFLTALIAVVAVMRRWIKDERVWFWMIVAVIAWFLLLGSSTPLHRLIYHVPVLNSFRVPSRHTFEWTLAISVLAAFGWDVGDSYFRRRLKQKPSRTNFNLTFASLLLVASAIVGVLFWQSVVQLPEPSTTTFTGLAEGFYWYWKLTFAALVIGAAAVSLGIARKRVRVTYLLITISLACFVEANATATCWWGGLLSLPRERFHVVSNSTRYLKQFAPEQHRVYTRVALFSEEFTTEPRLEATNLTMMYGLQNVAGMEPLIMRRYSRALGNVGSDSVTPQLGMVYKDDLFTPRSHVLDILNTTHLVTYAGSLRLYEEVTTSHDRVRLSIVELNVTLAPGQAVDFSNRQTYGDELALVTSLSNSAGESDGKPVAQVSFITTDGRTIHRDLLAGTHTAEWAHERPDVRPNMKHRLATVFDQRPGDANNTFPSYRYWGRIKLDTPERIERVQIKNVSQTAAISIWKLSLVDSRDLQSSPLWVAASPAWTRVFEDRGVEVLENRQAMPRVWLVAHAKAVHGEEALAAIRGESAEPFDPRETVLLEVNPNEMPALPQAKLSPGSEAMLREHKAHRLSIETNSPTNTMLVVSEMFYPGWEATIDGERAPIILANYLLRAVYVPAGKHRIEMRYTAPAVRNGAIISAATLIFLVALLIRTRRAKQTHPDQHKK